MHFSLFPFRIGPSRTQGRGVRQIFANVLGVRGETATASFFFLRAGAGFASQDLFLHGFFSAAIKLPADYAAGVVVAFYVRAAAMPETDPSSIPLTLSLPGAIRR